MVHASARFFLLSVVCFLVAASPAAAEQRGTTDKVSMGVRQEVERRYSAWRDYLASLPPNPSGEFDSKAVFDNAPFKALVALGPRAVPCLLEKVKNDHLAGHALFRITKYKWHVKRQGSGPADWTWTIEEFADLSSSKGPPDARIVWLRWWNEGRQRAGQNFERAHAAWKAAKETKQPAPASEAMQRMADIGIDVLPLAIQRIRTGEVDLIPLVSTLTDGAVSQYASPAAVLAWWQHYKADWTLPGRDGDTTGN